MLSHDWIKEKYHTNFFTNKTPSLEPSQMGVFGCSAYVLRKEIQDKNTTGKFSKKRRYLGVLVGFSVQNIDDMFTFQFHLFETPTCFWTLDILSHCS